MHGRTVPRAARILDVGSALGQAEVPPHPSVCSNRIDAASVAAALRPQPGSGEHDGYGTRLKEGGPAIGAERCRAVVERLHEEVYIKNNIDVVDELVSPAYVGHHADSEMGREQEFRQVLPALRQSFPDVEFTFRQTIVEDNIAASRFTMSGTHTGHFMGVPPTGKKFRISGQILYRMDDGRVVESWSLRNDLGMMQQLGLVTMASPLPE